MTEDLLHILRLSLLMVETENECALARFFGRRFNFLNHNIEQQTPKSEKCFSAFLFFHFAFQTVFRLPKFEAV